MYQQNPYNPPSHSEQADSQERVESTTLLFSEPIPPTNGAQPMMPIRLMLMPFAASRYRYQRIIHGIEDGLRLHWLWRLWLVWDGTVLNSKEGE